jgi:hypothetical protein
MSPGLRAPLMPEDQPLLGMSVGRFMNRKEELTVVSLAPARSKSPERGSHHPKEGYIVRMRPSDAGRRLVCEVCISWAP